jgi:hypothetical protein
LPVIRFVVNKPLGIRQGGLPDFHKEIAFLRQPGALERQMALIDQAEGRQPLGRIFVMGCGRSGTWLVAAVLSSLDGLDFFPEEVPLEYFGLVTTDRPVLALKRDATAHQRVEHIPQNIQIVFIVRHPFDVLTSHNPTVAQNAYHITPARWLGETLALQYLVDTARPNTMIVRYEDLVDDPHGTQARLGRHLGLAITRTPEQVREDFAVSAQTIKATHGLRPIDRKSVECFRRDPALLSHLRKIRPRLGRLLDWVAQTYSYDISLETP